MNQPRLTFLVRADLQDFNFGSNINPDSKVHRANMGPTWVLSGKALLSLWQCQTD